MLRVDRVDKPSAKRLELPEIGLGERDAVVAVGDLDDADDAVASLDRHGQQTVGVEARLPIDAAVEARVVLHVVDQRAASGARHPAGDALLRRHAQAGDRVLPQGFGRGEHQLVAFAVVEQQRQRLGLGQHLDAIEDDAQDLRQLERRGERLDQLVDGGELAQPLRERVIGFRRAHESCTRDTADRA